MPSDKLTIEAFTKEGYAFTVTRLFPDEEESDDSITALAVYRSLGNDDPWFLRGVHAVTERNVLKEESNLETPGYIKDTADRECAYEAGPFRVHVAEIVKGGGWDNETLQAIIQDVHFEIDEQGRPTSEKIRARRQRENTIREQETRDQMSFNDQFQIDEDGHVTPR